MRNPEQRGRLQESIDRGETGLLDTGIEELLRYDGPVELATWRFATEPLTVGGQRIATGDPVLVVLAAADRDPARFSEPDTLDLTRRDNQHLGYGHGIHYCLGAPWPASKAAPPSKPCCAACPTSNSPPTPPTSAGGAASSCADYESCPCGSPPPERARSSVCLIASR